MPNSVTIERVSAFKMLVNEKISENTAQVQLNCPKSILQAFQRILENTAILGATFNNPYTKKNETFPKHATDLTARHLQLLARNEMFNVNGVMQCKLYKNLLTNDQIASIRCLVKATTVSGLCVQYSYGGFFTPHIKLSDEKLVIIIDQSGLQWQGDFRNTGGMFFYPTDPESKQLPQGYIEWQKQMYQAMYDAPRPELSKNILAVNWRSVPGFVDLKQITHAIALEFRQALDSAVSQGNVELQSEEKINFRFLKAGMGFFAEGIVEKNTLQSAQLQLARLQGIVQALLEISKLPEEERKIVLGKVQCLEFPFSELNQVEASANETVIFFNKTVEQMRGLTNTLGLVWGGTPTTDALKPSEGYIVATTNCGDPHVMIGNEGGHQSVDASISMNADLRLLNPGYNHDMKLILTESYNIKSEDILGEAVLEDVVVDTTKVLPASSNTRIMTMAAIVIFSLGLTVLSFAFLSPIMSFVLGVPLALVGLGLGIALGMNLYRDRQADVKLEQESVDLCLEQRDVNQNAVPRAAPDISSTTYSLDRNSSIANDLQISNPHQKVSFKNK